MQMSNYDFYLYRIKINFPEQMRLFRERLSRPEIIQRLIISKPSSELYKGNYWHIGNVKQLDGKGGVFAVGKTTKSILEKYDETTGNFIEEVDETSPYTHVVYDSELGVIAIAYKNKLSSTVNGIANKLRGLLQSSEITFEDGLTILLDPISDPKDFIDALMGAYSVKSFSISFTRPNPIDVEELFQKPMEKYLEVANGAEGLTTIKGEDLNSDTLVEMAKSAATTGNDAKAKLKPTIKDKLIKKSLKSNPAHFLLSEDEFTEEIALNQVRKAYKTLRGNYDGLG
jgi:hypothetical protein